MTETNTLINWPIRLKVGARSKKGKLKSNFTKIVLCLFIYTYTSLTGKQISATANVIFFKKIENKRYIYEPG